MTAPRFQFTLRGMLWATFWLAVTFTFGRFGLSSDSPALGHVGFAAVTIGPCVTMGWLFQRPKTGLAVGVIVALLVYLTLAISVYNAYRN